MIPAKLDLSITRGITFGPLTLVAQESSVGPVVNLTGYTVFGDVRLDLQASVAFSLPLTITNAAAGEITLTYTDEQTMALPLGVYSWDMALSVGGVRLGPFLAGRVTVADINTRP